MASLADAMVRTLESAKKPVPPYLALFRREVVARRDGVETAIFGMG
ncbi:MAG: hypothetical protein KDC38_20985 [Planctomycetes bacterium]|nr:hypothetical protein [Planctomycetota bacterium]